MIKDAIANIAKWPPPETLQAVSHATEMPSRSFTALKLLFASDVPLRGLHRSVPKEKLNLFHFASPTIAQARASVSKIVGCQISYAGRLTPCSPAAQIVRLDEKCRHDYREMLTGTAFTVQCRNVYPQRARILAKTCKPFHLVLAA